MREILDEFVHATISGSNELDDFTLRHLWKWCARRDENPGPLYDKIVAFLQSKDSKDAEYLIDAGWPFVADRLDEHENN